MIVDPLLVIHLSVDMVNEIHSKTIARFGGSLGIRDNHLLESAVAAPQATFGGIPPYDDVIEIGAAYLFFLSRNHPFIDGNKRTALSGCLTFLRMNGFSFNQDSDALELLAMDIASSTIDRKETTKRLRALLTG